MKSDAAMRPSPKLATTSHQRDRHPTKAVRVVVSVVTFSCRMLGGIPIERTAVSVAMVAPNAIIEQSKGETIHVTFSGRFGFGIDQWAYLPFEVPAGVQRIRVSTSHDQFAVGGLIRSIASCCFKGA